MKIRNEDDAYNVLVELNNSMREAGYTEIEILRYLLGWIKGAITTAEEYSYANMDEYNQLKKEIGYETN